MFAIKKSVLSTVSYMITIIVRYFIHLRDHKVKRYQAIVTLDTRFDELLCMHVNDVHMYS